MLNYLPILIFLVIACIFPLVGLGASWLLQMKKPEKVKGEAYECGIKAEASARDRFSIRFYVIALLFVVFDVETVFLFPWAILFPRLLVFGLIEMGLFIGILFLGYWYAWKKGALEWA